MRASVSLSILFLAAMLLAVLLMPSPVQAACTGKGGGAIICPPGIPDGSKFVFINPAGGKEFQPPGTTSSDDQVTFNGPCCTPSVTGQGQTGLTSGKLSTPLWPGDEIEKQMFHDLGMDIDLDGVIDILALNRGPGSLSGQAPVSVAIGRLNNDAISDFIMITLLSGANVFYSGITGDDWGDYKVIRYGDGRIERKYPDGRVEVVQEGNQQPDWPSGSPEGAFNLPPVPTMDAASAPTPGME